MKNIKYILIFFILATLVILGVVNFSKTQRETVQTTNTISNTSALDAISAPWAGAAKKYIVSKYPNHKIVSVTPDPMCTGEDAIDVTIENSSDKLSLIFLLNGDFVQSEVDEPFTNTDTQLFNILKKQYADHPEKYADYSYGDSYESLTMANGESRYLVDLSKDNGKITSELILNTKGEVLCQTNAK